MRLSVSNLALPMPELSDSEYAGLVAAGLSGLELAPTRVAPWPDLTAEVARNHARHLADNGLAVSSLQALLYGTEGMALLKDAAAFDAMKAHMGRVAALCAAFGAKVGVFGAPFQRARGDMTAEAAFDLGRARFAELAAICHDQGMVIGLEPVPAHYRGDFLPGWRDVLAMVEAVDHPGLGVHLDTACVTLGGDDIAEAIGACRRRLVHFHAAEPDLKSFQAPCPSHACAARALAEAEAEDGLNLPWIAIEMLNRSEARDLSEVLRAIAYVLETYRFDGENL